MRLPTGSHWTAGAAAAVAARPVADQPAFLGSTPPRAPPPFSPEGYTVTRWMAPPLGTNERSTAKMSTERTCSQSRSTAARRGVASGSSGTWRGAAGAETLELCGCGGQRVGGVGTGAATAPAMQVPAAPTNQLTVQRTAPRALPLFNDSVPQAPNHTQRHIPQGQECRTCSSGLAASAPMPHSSRSCSFSGSSSSPPPSATSGCRP